MATDPSEGFYESQQNLPKVFFEKGSKAKLVAYLGNGTFGRFLQISVEDQKLGSGSSFQNEPPQYRSYFSNIIFLVNRTFGVDKR